MTGDITSIFINSVEPVNGKARYLVHPMFENLGR